MTPPAAPNRRRRLSLRAMLTILALSAFAYVAIVGFFVAFRIGPMAESLQRQSAGVLGEFTESARRAEELDAIRSDLTRMLVRERADTAPPLLDSLEAHRRRLQSMLDAPRAFNAVTWPEGIPLAFRAVLVSAAGQEATLGSVLLGAVAALETEDVELATTLMRHADSLDAPLANSLTDATALTLRNVNLHETQLAETARAAARSVGLWLLAGLILFPLVGLLLHHRLYAPLEALDRGLARIAGGDLDITLTATHDDELGRLTHHFNEMSALLRRRAVEQEERAALRTAARTRRILEAALDAVVVIDADGVVHEWSPQATEVLGWSRAEAIGRPLAALVGLDATPQDGPGGLPLQNTRVERTIRHRTGREVPIELALTPLHGDGEVTEYSVFLRDITERREAQAALADSEERYRSAFEQAAIGMAEVSADARYLRVNRAFAKILGREPREVERLRVPDVTHPDDAAADTEAIRRLFTGEVPMLQMEKRYLRPDGRIAWANIASALVRMPSGDPGFAISVIQDITDRKLLEEELRQSQKMEAVGRLAGGIAHDFNNLLTAIIGYADLLQRVHHDEASIQDDVAAIRSAAQRGADLSRKLLAFARREPIRTEAVDLDRVVREVADLLQRTLDRRIVVQLQLVEPAAFVAGDHTQLVNALLNLAINSRDAMPLGGTMTFSTDVTVADAAFVARYPESRRGATYAALSLKDTGSGMTPEVLARLFEPFFTTKPLGQGTGLGLAMVYGTVRSHGGHVEVDSTPAVGTTFTIYLPVATGPSATTTAAPAAPRPGTGRILLADDEAMVRDVGARLLRRLGYEVDTANDGEEAALKVRDAAVPYDVIILDGNMPRMTGREACRRIRVLRPTARVVLASGYVEASSDQELAEDGFSDVIHKPYDLATLSRVVAEQIADA